MADWAKVILVRNVGIEISEEDLLELMQPFGTVAKLVISRPENEALVEMEDLDSAVIAVESYRDEPAIVRGTNVLLQFSSDQELTTTDQSTQGSKSDQESKPNRILFVTIHHMLYPITMEVLHQVFSSHGFVEKVVRVRKSPGFQALVQYESQENAVQARNALQARNIYDGCCQLHIQFSNLSKLHVNRNDDCYRDFTNPNLPTEQSSSSAQGYDDAGGVHGMQTSRRVACPQMGCAAAIEAAFGGVLPNGITGTNDRCSLLVTNLNPDKIDEKKLFNLFSCYGNIIRIKLLRRKPDHAFIQMEDGFQAELAVHFLKGAIVFGKKIDVSFSRHPIIMSGADTHEYAGSIYNRFYKNDIKRYKYCRAPTKVIHVSFLPQDITENEIIAHLEEHGTILKSKLYEVNGKMQALVQFEDEVQATEALMCKHASTIDWSTIRISFTQVLNIRD